MVLSILVSISSIAYKAQQGEEQMNALLEVLAPVKKHISPNTIISFEPSDSLKLYFQSQLALAPIVLDKENRHDTILIFQHNPANLELQTVSNNEGILWEATFNDFLIRLKSIK